MIIALVAVHVAAVLFHLIYKGENLITRMITGIKHWPSDFSEDTSQQPFWLAAMVAVIAAAAVYLLVQ